MSKTNKTRKIYLQCKSQVTKSATLSRKTTLIIYLHTIKKSDSSHTRITTFLIVINDYTRWAEMRRAKCSASKSIYYSLVYQTCRQSIVACIEECCIIIIQLFSCGENEALIYRHTFILLPIYTDTDAHTHTPQKCFTRDHHRSAGWGRSAGFRFHHRTMIIILPLWFSVAHLHRIYIYLNQKKFFSDYLLSRTDILYI